MIHNTQRLKCIEYKYICVLPYSIFSIYIRHLYVGSVFILFIQNEHNSIEINIYECRRSVGLHIGKYVQMAPDCVSTIFMLYTFYIYEEEEEKKISLERRKISSILGYYMFLIIIILYNVRAIYTKV